MKFVSVSISPFYLCQIAHLQRVLTESCYQYKPGEDRDHDEDDAKSVGDQEKDAARMKVIT